MTRSALVVDDVVHRLEGSRLWLRLGDERAEVGLDAVGQAAVEAAVALVESRLDAGDGLDAAVESVVGTIRDIPGRTARRPLANGAVLLDDTAAATALDVRASLRVLADIARGRSRSFAVLGELETAPADWFDDHDALGRIVVRLDVSQLIVVGEGARHIHNAAGLEGSWDGESILVGTLEQAYDVVRAQVDEGDVVLVSAASRTPLHDLVRLLLEADA
ncbi:glutamate ligase domain-containing protein [Microcella sp.]|uniref:glutamate ligase domain-containing protein n=1 Tax=Microcella sp. TaxID=1913979 RepID=UPI003F6EA23F